MDQPTDASEVKRPVMLGVVSLYLVAAGLLGLAALVGAQGRQLGLVGKVVSVLPASIQLASGWLLFVGSRLGRRLYLVAMPIGILGYLAYVGMKAGFDDGPLLHLIPFAIYGLVAFLLTRESTSEWLGPRRP